MTYLKTQQVSPTKKKKKPKNERKDLIKKLDQLIRDILKKRDSKCCCCGKSEGLQVGHYVTRRVYALRWELTNVHLQCGGCNVQHNHDPLPYTRFMLSRYGKEGFDGLVAKKDGVRKMTTVMMRELVEELERKT